MADISFKRGDLKRPIVRQLRETVVDEIAGTTTVQAIDLTNATQVKLLLKDTQTSSTGGGTCTFVDRTNGIVSYLTQTADLAAVRLWNMEFEITWTDGGIQTVPNKAPAGHTDPYYTIEVLGDLG